MIDYLFIYLFVCFYNLECLFLLQDRTTISIMINQIASTALKLDHGSYFEMITEKYMKLTEHDCYKSVTQYIHQKCFDLQV